MSVLRSANEKRSGVLDELRKCRRHSPADSCFIALASLGVHLPSGPSPSTQGTKLGGQASLTVSVCSTALAGSSACLRGRVSAAGAQQHGAYARTFAGDELPFPISRAERSDDLNTACCHAHTRQY